MTVPIASLQRQLCLRAQFPFSWQLIPPPLYAIGANTQQHLPQAISSTYSVFCRILIPANRVAQQKSLYPCHLVTLLHTTHQIT